MSINLLGNLALERDQIKEKKQAIAMEIAKLDSRLRELDVIEKYLRENANQAGDNVPLAMVGAYASSLSTPLLENRRVRLGGDKRKIFEAIRDKPLTKMEIELLTLLDFKSISNGLRDGMAKGDIFNSENRYGLTETGIALLDAVEKREGKSSQNIKITAT
jgi:hypothetical protein